MPRTPVGPDLDQSLDVEGDLLAQIAFHGTLSFDGLGDPAHFLFREILDPNVGIDLDLGEDLAGPVWTDAVNVLETCLDPFGSREVDACDASHSLPLPLLMLGVRADDADDALPPDDAALDANFLDRRSDLHFLRLRFIYLSLIL
jgi:hypothetical protein